MGWQIELCKALVDIVKQGGVYALWGIGIWMGIGLLRVAIIGGVVWAVIRLLVQSINNYLAIRFLTRKDNIQILSDKVSGHITKCLQDYQDRTSQALNDFLKDANELLKKSEQKTTTTVLAKN